MAPVKIGVLISGGGTNLQSIIDNISTGYINGKIELIVSNRENAYGLTRGKDAGIETMFVDTKKFSSDRDYNYFITEAFKKRGIQLIVLAGYLKVLNEEFVKTYKNRIINIHPSLIPSFSGKGYYGEKIHKEVLDYGVKYTGATVHFVDEGTDTGPIILQEVVKVEDDDTVESLQKKVLKVEHKLLVEAIKLFCEDRLIINNRHIVVKCL